MRLQLFVGSIFACGGLLLADGAVVHAKAILAQQLLNLAWLQTGAFGAPQPPWPWADTWPVARLRIARLGVEQIVLAGTDGAALAFGPGHLFRSALPGGGANTVIAGHRDTHFKYLRELRRGDEITVERIAGEVVTYAVSGIHIVHEDDTSVLAAGAADKLTLITCYPFDALESGGLFRYVIVAMPLPS
ncbi:MAG TPA: class GN sortase [Gammaproteobacteria bacterium]|jgi:sortase A|nr:class GN sortase [Gammaproteobacteria bacterium]